MDIHSNLEYLCRVCAANTKGKHSVAECVYILKTAGLKDKLDKFLYLKVSENDSLPKVLCKSCFRQVEATASLSKIAKHTQQVFRDFLLSNLPKGPSEFTNSSEFTSSDFMGTIDTNEKCKKDEIVVPPLAQLPVPPATASLLIPQLSQPLMKTSCKDEVVVNVSVADPLTRDNQQKMISNSQRRQSLLLESRFTPKSIAQKPAKTNAFPRLIAPKPNQSLETLNATNNLKIKTPPLNFYPAKGQQQLKLQHPPQTTQITTFSSGGYVIGRINSDTCLKEETKKITLPLAATAENILQQKRKNLVKALNNIKANNSGQISLLKSSQQKQAEVMQNTAKTPLNEVFNQTTEDELPEKIIIAAPKNKFLAEKVKKEPLNLSSKVAGSAIQLPPTNSKTLLQQQQEHINAFAATPPKTAFPEDILLGRVIRDMDLLKLILKALKWSVNKQNMELQLQRLKNSKFTDIMSDPNLLQDTDLTQLLGPYLAPVLLAAQALQQQQQQILKNASFNQNMLETFSQPTQPKMTALEAAQAEINKSIPYKLPPETSVQLVPAIPEETDATEPPLLTTMINSSLTSVAVKREKQGEPKITAVPQKRQRKAQRAKNSIVLSDGEDTSAEDEVPKKTRQHSPKSTSNIQIELKPNFMSQFNLFNGSGGNEADELMALLLKQQAALMKDKKIQRRRRNSLSNFMALPPSEFDALIDLDDDIVLMEPVTTTNSSETNSSNQEPQQHKTEVPNTFVIPSVPLITRPIIKRRKTVIHSPKNKFDLSIELKNKDSTPISSSTNVRNKEKLLEETINQVATGNTTSAEISNQQNYSKTINNEVAVIAPAPLMTKKSSQQKKMQNKSTLGQQLLEAIGLQKISPKIENNSQAEEASSSSPSNAITVLPNSKQSIQQIRSALKKSLKQAQEQQQQKKKELSSSNSNTVIQDADSTTKSAIKEIVVVEGKGNNNSDNSSSIIDVEDQIDKVTLMVRKNDEEQNSDQLTIKPTTENDEKKEAKKSSSIKIQERRRTMLTASSRGIGTRNLNEKEKSSEGDQQEKIVENNDTINEKGKMEKNDVVNISSSSVAIANASNETATTNDEIVTPKRRGRKRLADKQSELEAAETNEKDKVLPTLTEKSRTDVKSREEETETTNINKNEEEIESNTTSSRPTRQSKTQSKYYKGPEKSTLSRRSLPSRTTRNRKYC